MRKVPFAKMSGSGNDFIVLDNRGKTLPRDYAPLARALCERRLGVGADGILVLEPDARAAFRMVILNSDGSRAMMCGNGARCIAWYAHELGIVGRTFRFAADAYPVRAQVNGRQVRVSLAAAHGWRPRVPARAEGKFYDAAYINMGVPHGVVFVRDLRRVAMAREGCALRWSSAFTPAGANINFVQVLGRHRIRVRTFERGVEAETLACGTGVSASAIASALRGKVSPPVACEVAGGDTLEVAFRVVAKPAGAPVESVSLRGPVKLTFRGEAYV